MHFQLNLCPGLGFGLHVAGLLQQHIESVKGLDVAHGLSQHTCLGLAQMLPVLFAYVSLFWPRCHMWYPTASLPWLLPMSCMCFASACGSSVAEEAVIGSVTSARADAVQHATKRTVLCESKFLTQVLNANSQCRFSMQVLSAILTANSRDKF